jgi:hypothetical protein
MQKFYFSPQVPYLYRLHDKKILKIQDIKISHLGTFKVALAASEAKIGDISGRRCRAQPPMVSLELPLKVASKGTPHILVRGL